MTLFLFRLCVCAGVNCAYRLNKQTMSTTNNKQQMTAAMTMTAIIHASRPPALLAPLPFAFNANAGFFGFVLYCFLKNK